MTQLEERTEIELLKLLPATINIPGTVNYANLTILIGDVPEDEVCYTVGYVDLSTNIYTHRLNWYCGHGDRTLKDAIIGLFDIMINRLNYNLNL